MHLSLASPVMTTSERALLRIREEMTERHLSQRDLAEALKCSQSRVAKILHGGVNLRLDDLQTLANAVGVSLTEVLRDRGLEFYAEMTPTELRVLEKVRRRPAVLHAVMLLLDMKGAPEPPAAVPKRPKRGRPLHSEAAKR